MRTVALLLSILLCGAAPYASEAPRAAAPAPPAAPHSAPVSLLLVEYGENAAGEQTQTLKRYRFRNGKLAATEEIVTTETQDVRYDLDENRLYRGRFIITHWGDVIDIVERKVLHRGDGEVLGIEGDHVVMEVNRVDLSGEGKDLSGLFAYDLATHRYSRLSRVGPWVLPGLLSPDQEKSVDSEGASIWLHSLTGERKLLGDRFTGGGGLDCSSSYRASVLWLDDQRIVTHRGREIVLVDVATAAVTPVVDVPVGEVKHGCGPELYRDREGSVIYSWPGHAVVIDVGRKTYAPYLWMPLGHGFSVEEERNASYGHVIRQGEKEIGRLWASTWGARTTQGYLALEYGAVGSNLGYPEGVKVWSETTREWTAITPKWHTTIIGWVDD